MQSNVAFFVTVFCVSTSTQTTYRVYSCDVTYIPHTFCTPCWGFLVGLWVFLGLGALFQMQSLQSVLLFHPDDSYVGLPISF